MSSLKQVTLGLALVCPAVFGQNAPGPLPDTPAKKVLEKSCATCHELESVLGTRRTKIGWQQSVDDMVARGAEGSDQDLAAIVEYLTTYFGKVNVNTAAAADLEKALGLSSAEAKAVIAYRDQNGKIKDFDDLKKVPEVSAEKLQSKRGLIAYSQ